MLADPTSPPTSPPDALSPAAFEALCLRERASDRYWRRNDTIRKERLYWRAQTARHLFHILPGETVLVLAGGTGGLAATLRNVTRGECPLTVATFDPAVDPDEIHRNVPEAEVIALRGFPGDLSGREFDYVIGSNVLDARGAPILLREIQKLLKPGGRLLLFETNPWNPFYRFRSALSRLLPFLRRGDERVLYNQVQLYELFSELGYISVAATCYDFLYPPIPRFLMILARNLCTLLDDRAAERLQADLDHQ